MNLGFDDYTRGIEKKSLRYLGGNRRVRLYSNSGTIFNSGAKQLSFFLINCYACMIGITSYGIILLKNPFMSGLVAPTPHEMIYKEIKAGFFS